MAIGEAAGRLGLRPSALRLLRRMYGPAELRQLASVGADADLADRPDARDIAERDQGGAGQ
ncbi:MAG TPA: hypothetical protein VGR98_03020 [Streptosporangiaceae bacterium]|nr:hypothetical protein [Streptosporangiaceae bacterium]